jgi:hypothetical protein
MRINRQFLLRYLKSDFLEKGRESGFTVKVIKKIFLFACNAALAAC